MNVKGITDSLEIHSISSQHSDSSDDLEHTSKSDSEKSVHLFIDKKVELTRKIPITSYGILLYLESEEPLFLLTQRRDSISYVDFIRGNYKQEDTLKMLNLMTEEERVRIQTHSFQELWDNLWFKHTFFYLKEIRYATERFEMIRGGLNDLLNKVEKKDQVLEWGFPKGKRNRGESSFDCALREFKEETRLSPDSIEIVPCAPYIEIYEGTNGKTYRTVYYIAKAKDKLPLLKMETGDQISKTTISHEIGDMRWASLDEAVKIINTHRGEMLSALRKSI